MFFWYIVEIKALAKLVNPYFDGSYIFLLLYVIITILSFEYSKYLIVI
jgi:hypothetical protein